MDKFTPKILESTHRISRIITSIYFIDENNKKYENYKEPNCPQLRYGENQLGYTYSELKTLKDHYRRNRDISYFSFK